MIIEFITGKIESISKIHKNNDSSYRTVTLFLPGNTELEKKSPLLFEDSLQDAIIDGVMTSDEAEEIRKKANKTVQTEIIFNNINLLNNITEKDFVYIIAEPYSAPNNQNSKLSKLIVNQGLFITKDSNEFQKAKMNAFRDMEKERQNWNK